MAKQCATMELDRLRSLRYVMNAIAKIEEMISRLISKLDAENISINGMGTTDYELVELK